MTPTSYTEYELIELPAIELLESMGWEAYNAYGEFEHAHSPLGRENKSEVVLTSRLRPVLEKLNPDLPPVAIDEAIAELTRDRSRLSMVAANSEIYKLLKEGIPVRIPDPDQGDRLERLRVVDWEEPLNNDFLLCSQLWVNGEMHTRRPDLVGFVNGLPLVLIELKAINQRVESAYNDNLRDYKDTIPNIFWHNAMIVLSNGIESKIGTVTAGWEHFSDWKKVGSETEEGRISLETMLRGTCEPGRLLDLVENFTLFMTIPKGQAKIIAKNHQYLGVQNALSALTDIKERRGRLGVFWHTQGSGKSISMIFFSQKVLRKVPGNWSFVIVTDRRELDDQIYKNFVSTGVVTKGKAQADSSRGLRELLREDHRYIFTLIHKFRTEPGQSHPMLTDREDVIVITDEAHRSQYDTLALNMRTALPNASFIAFTGTPLIAGEEKTRQVFGDYISVYDFRQSVEDKATVPLYYENRTPELDIINEDFNQDMERLLEEAELDEEQEKKLEREFAREYHLITRNDRLEAVADDIVNHFTNRGYQGKAMAICIDKATAVRMYDKVQKHWQIKLQELNMILPTLGEPDRTELEEQIRLMEETDMAVVVSQSQNEIGDLDKKGLDIRPHRKRMIEEDLEGKFKDPDDPFRLVFVCAMWMTGFDVPSCSTLYLDKPMRNHTLMQTIARANRVYKDKVSGLIVDYANIFRNLEQALSIYGPGGAGGKGPVEDKAELVEMLKTTIKDTFALCREKGIDPQMIKDARAFEQAELLKDAVDALVADDEATKRYLEMAALVNRLYKAVLPDQEAQLVRSDCALIKILADMIKAIAGPVNIDDVMVDVENLLDQSIGPKGYEIREKAGPEEEYLVDLSKIDFDKLRAKFNEGRKNIEAEKLKGRLAQKIKKMVRLNHTRIDYLEKFQELIDAYNRGSMNVEEYFKQLMNIAENLVAEEKRAISENLSEEELALFDILTKPNVELTDKEVDQVKKAARELLEKLKKEMLVLDWRKRQQARANVKVTIEKELDRTLPEAFTAELYEEKTAAVYQHIYDNYFGAGKSIYSAVA